MSARDAEPPGQTDDSSRLAEACAALGAMGGTVHRREGDRLVLTAAHRMPPSVVARTATIPRGKGMAGLAWQRGEPVSTCDLQSDPTDDVRPGARAVAAGRAVALPVFWRGAAGEDEVAVVGFAFRDTGEFDAASLARLSRYARITVRPSGRPAKST